MLSPEELGYGELTQVMSKCMLESIYDLEILWLPPVFLCKIFAE
jgi:hypothetical protein